MWTIIQYCSKKRGSYLYIFFCQQKLQIYKTMHLGCTEIYVFKQSKRDWNISRPMRLWSFLKKKKNKTSCLAVNHMYNHGFYRTCPKFTTRRHGTTTEHHVVEMTGNKIMCYQHVKENSERTGAPCWTGLLWVNSWALCLWPSSNPPYVTILDDAS